MWAVFIVAAALVAAVAFWVLRAYRRASATAPPAPALIACALIAVGSIGLYLAIGKPNLPDLPFKARIAALSHRDPNTFSVDEFLAVVDNMARDRPADASPHIMMGQVYLSRDPDKAAREFDAALRRDPNSREARLGLARALVAANEGHVPPEAKRVFEFLSTDSADPTPWIYLGIAALQAGQDARPMWLHALAQLPANDPLRRDSSDWRIGLGRAIVSVEGHMTPEALALFQQAGASSRDPAPWIYQAMAAMQSNQDSRHFWAEALARMRPDDPRRAMAQQMSRGE